MQQRVTDSKDCATRFKLARRAHTIAGKFLDKRQENATYKMHGGKLVSEQQHWVYKIRRIGGYQGITKQQIKDGAKAVVLPVRFIIEFRQHNEDGPIVGYLEMI